MSTAPILRIALPTPLRRLFDYLSPQDIDYKPLIPGLRVRVPFQSRQLVGILIEIVYETQVPKNKLKYASEILDEHPIFSADINKLCAWAADYYHYALGEVFAGAMPSLLRKGKSTAYKKKKNKKILKETEAWPSLNADQIQAVQIINSHENGYHTFLLDGVTGSGKTEVYLHAIKKVLEANQQVLVLLPEISLTPQTIARFSSRFSISIMTFHSGLSEQQRLRTWVDAAQGHAKIVIGTRSAVFIPFARLGLIVVDEEHDSSFKQQERFRYHARDVAVMRAHINNIPIILGSATPSLESFWNAKKSRYHYLSLPQRAGNAELPTYRLIDLTRHPLKNGLSEPLQQALHQHLSQNNQVMLFLNRRGFAPVLFCTECAWVASCKRCDVRLVYHRHPHGLQCHHCGVHSKIPKTCAHCQGQTLQPIGFGTQRLEETLSECFPGIPIIRVDRDTTRRKDSLQELLTKIHTEDRAILLGTQMLAKGHHFPNVTLVGVIDADGGLFSADFRATEQMGQLLLQISGRAGRAEKSGAVFIQTRYPSHPLLQILLAKGYGKFAELLLEERKHGDLPPFSYFALLRAEAYVEQSVLKFLTQVKILIQSCDQELSVLGPVPALLAKRKSLHCQHLLLKAKSRRQLQIILNSIVPQIENWPESKTIKWVLDVDPIEVL